MVAFCFLYVISSSIFLVKQVMDLVSFGLLQGLSPNAARDPAQYVHMYGSLCMHACWFLASLLVVRHDQANGPTSFLDHMILEYPRVPDLHRNKESRQNLHARASRV